MAFDTENIERLHLLGSFGLSVGTQYEMLSDKFVGGFRVDLRAGPKGGTEFAQLKYNVLPQAQGQKVGVGNGAYEETQLDYLYNFYVRKMDNNREPFIAMHPRTRKDFLWVFAEDSLTLEMFAAYLYSTGVRLEQCRIAGFVLTDTSENPQTI